MLELRKGIDAGFKDVDPKKRIVCGYFAHFGSKDLAGDIIRPGAFTETIAKRSYGANGLIKHLLDHKKDNGVGVIQLLKEDEIGLYYESKAGRHTAGNDFLLMVEDGLINQHSFGYVVEAESKSAEGNILEKLIMTEGSSLQFLGCNPNTPVTGIKALSDVMNDLSNLENALKNGSYSDDTFRAIEEKVRIIYTLLRTDDAKQSLFSLMAREQQQANN